MSPAFRFEPTVSLAICPNDLVTGRTANAGEASSASRWAKLRYRMLTGTWLPKPDPVKAWDVKNVTILAERLERNASVLDCGAFCSPSLHGLLGLGLRNLHGIDLNPHLLFLPSASRVNYSVQDIQRTAFADASFDFVYSASVIEHGVSWQAFLAEARRLLKPGGLFYLSTDLVPDEVDTTHGRAFGLPWLPLRATDVSAACARLHAAGFVAPSVPPLRQLDSLPCSFMGIRHGFISFTCIART